ncbi:spectinomycin phosphotransferase [Ktedonobacter sp. SOSP1-85]|uniref:phosphotransferase enzyme family protein n=1 Tax=Ktedonobacter sp. SOSP1-85 TaxID=2778367 RepID=UPI001915A1EA|nr:aminoglycoside phosphotransferase family protein [Ktedonobacter sp. SOSP1-85]GHO79010.1 spectinomycin phosphotransferase [Ktedonobacter sp. SOSP1-85]
MSKEPGLSDESLHHCLEEQYALNAATFELLSQGLDVNARVYRVVSEQGGAYLLKARQGQFYEPACRVPRYLRDQGVTSVVAPLPTREQALWVTVDKWTLVLYPFIDGDSSWNPSMDDTYWRSLGAAFKQIHHVKPPAESFQGLRKEAFDPVAYRRGMQTIEARLAQFVGDRAFEQSLYRNLMAYQATIHAVMDSMETLADHLRQQAGPLVICHADLHTANIIRTSDGEVFIIDWDDIMLAPRERDFIFVGEAQAADPPAPFFQGYGEVALDWRALKYYRLERVIQDLIECASQVLFRADLDDETKIGAARLFEAILLERDWERL